MAQKVGTMKTQINILVYDLYGLTEPEKEIIRKG